MRDAQVTWHVRDGRCELADAWVAGRGHGVRTRSGIGGGCPSCGGLVKAARRAVMASDDVERGTPRRFDATRYPHARGGVYGCANIGTRDHTGNMVLHWCRRRRGASLSRDGATRPHGARILHRPPPPGVSGESARQSLCRPGVHPHRRSRTDDPGRRSAHSRAPRRRLRHRRAHLRVGRLGAGPLPPSVHRRARVRRRRGAGRRAGDGRARRATASPRKGTSSDGRCLLCRTGNSHVCPHTRIIGVDRDGCFAEYIAMPATNVWHLDDDISLRHRRHPRPDGERLPHRAHRRHSWRHGAHHRMRPDRAVRCRRSAARPARRASSPPTSTTRACELARTMGAHDAVHPDKAEAVVQRATDGLGVDVVLEMSGVPGGHPPGVRTRARPADASRCSAFPRGRSRSNFATEMIFKGITIYGVVGRRMYDTWHPDDAASSAPASSTRRL